MSRFKRILSVLFALTVFVGVLAAVVQGALWIAGKVVALPTALSVAIIAAVIAPISSVLTLAVTKYYERKAATLQEIRGKKTVVYESLLEAWTQMLMGERMGRSPKGEGEELSHEFLQKIDATSRGLIIWSNAEILRDWSRIKRRMAANSYQDNWVKMMGEMEALLRAIRTDIGQSNTKLAAGDIMGMFINDLAIPEDVDALAKPTSTAQSPVPGNEEDVAPNVDPVAQLPEAVLSGEEKTQKNEKG